MGQNVDIINTGMRFNDFWAVRNINVHIREGEFFSFLGPSGCGKTTLLRLVSGLLDPTEGEIRINGSNMKGIGPNKRNTSLIFQNLALFPLMSVAENIGFGLEVRGASKRERNKRVDELLELVDLSGIGASKVDDLSGGQKQRVAIARALAVDPSVLMLDEPLSALDLKLRKHMRVELQKIQRQTGVTFIYITHDQGEALTMSDRVAVMSRGKIEQLDTPDIIYNHPETLFVASFVGETNTFSGKISRTNGTTAVIETQAGTLHCRNPNKLSPGTRSTVFIRPETISLCNGSGGENKMACRVEQWAFEGPFINLAVRTVSGDALIVRMNNDGSGVSFNQKSSINITFDPENALLLAEGEAAHA